MSINVNIVYAIYEQGCRVGAVTNKQLREFFGYTDHSPVFTAELVERWNQLKAPYNMKLVPELINPRSRTTS